MSGGPATDPVVALTFTSMTPPLSSVTGKPVIVRVKRKASQAKLDAFWLEINERPHKKAFLDLGNLSISDCDTTKVLNELASKKMLVQRLETVGHSQSVEDVLHSFLDFHRSPASILPYTPKIIELLSSFLYLCAIEQPSGNTKDFKGRSKERRSLYKPDKKHDQLRSKAIKEHEDLARSARFEQIWKKRGSIDAEECSLHEKCHLYDVVRVDAEEERVPKPKSAPEVDGAILDKYLPLLREFLPQATKEIEHYKATKEDKFVYDIYTVGVGVDTDTDSTHEYPSVQVYVEDDYYDCPSQSDYESDDSNAENNPWNDYRDEESSEDEDEDENESPFTDLEDSDSEYEQEVASEWEDGENWRWKYR